MVRSNPIIVVIVSLFLWSAAVVSAAAGAITADSSGMVTIPLSKLSTTARSFEFREAGVTVRFFALTGTDGLPRVAFDACEVCGGRLGYEQRGSDIECRVCGRVFRIDDIGTKNRSSGCWPSYLPYAVRGVSIVIRVADLQRGRTLFQ